MLLDNPAGNYRFVRGTDPFASAVRAHPGYAIVRAAFHPFVSLDTGYAHVERHLGEQNRAITALCGMQLRIPRPLSREGFGEFNRPYIERLRGWGLEVDGANPVTRTNVAYELQPVASPMLASFFYTIPSSVAASTWVMAGVPEFESREGSVKIVAPGDITSEGLRQKTQCVVDVLGDRIRELEASWTDATTVNLYTVHDLHALMPSVLSPALGAAVQAGITWHYARPPVTGLELEIDAWSVAREEIIRP